MSKRVAFKLREQEVEYVNSFMNSIRKHNPGEDISLDQFAKECLLNGINSIVELGKKQAEARKQEEAVNGGESSKEREEENNADVLDDDSDDSNEDD